MKVEVVFLKKINKFIHKWSWSILLLFCIVGLFYPIIGIAALICMLAPVIVSFFKGRFWCGNFCPRGSFSDLFLAKISNKLQVPKFLKNQWFKLVFLILLMTSFAIQLYIAWGSLANVGAVFVRMIIITTILTIILGTIYSHRTWCTICPMGTMAYYIAKINRVNRKIKHVNFDKNKCINCNICTKNCPMGIDVLTQKDKGKVTHGDCLKCNVCIEKCPKNSLYIA
jgi:ferredoxin-type protein NapH